MKGEAKYVGVRASNAKGEAVYYHPVEIVTMVGWMTKESKKSHPILYTLLAVSVLIAALICYRRSRRIPPEYEQFRGI